jgi:protein-tyrosine phosphatase
VIDLHCHILPGLDDGARSLEESRELALRAAVDGVRSIVATPHVRSDYPTRAARMEFGVRELRRDFDVQRIPVEIHYGAEIELARLFEIPDEELQRLTLAHTGRYALLEFPYRGWPHQLPAAVHWLRARGITALLGHPERNPEVQDRPTRLAEAVREGALVQITAASLDGRLDRASKSTAEQLVALGFVHVLASDAHGPHVREAGLSAAARALGDEGLARYLTTEAPAAIVAGEPLPSR